MSKDRSRGGRTYRKREREEEEERAGERDITFR